jgi:hypothetical protein
MWEGGQFGSKHACGWVWSGKGQFQAWTTPHNSLSHAFLGPILPTPLPFQVTSPVLWENTMGDLFDKGLTKSYEIGPNKVRGHMEASGASARAGSSGRAHVHGLANEGGR